MSNVMRYKDKKTVNKDHSFLIQKDAGIGIVPVFIPSCAGSIPAPQAVENPSSSCVAKNRRGFTLIEMLVAMSILVVMMGAVGEIFQLAGHSVRVGQATLVTMSGVRAVQAQIASDIQHLDHGGYLIIRQGFWAPPWTSGQVYQPGDEVTAAGTAPGPVSEIYFCIKANTANVGNQPGSTATQYWSAPYATAASLAPAILWRDDQMTFIANGSFHSRTGNNTSSPLTDYVSSNAAAIWYGQLWVSQGLNQPYYLPQGTALPQNYPPSGATAGQFYLGRHVFILSPSAVAGGLTDPAFNNITFPLTGNPATSTATANGEIAAQITSSRFDVATISPAAAETAIGTASLQTAADEYCYRFASVSSPQASTQAGNGPAGAALNGYFRMTPIMLQGCPSFAVDVGYQNALGTLTWYGPDANPLANNPNALVYPSWSAANISETADNWDEQTLVFSQANKQYWPAAIKITYLVTDPTNRMNPQTITQIINFPQ